MDMFARTTVVESAEVEELAGAVSCPCGSNDLRIEKTRTAFWVDAGEDDREGERLVVVQGIPALVCQRCGEQFYDDATSIGLDLMRGAGFAPERAAQTIEVPVFDFEAPARSSA